jgi:uncharacterized membrane protein
MALERRKTIRRDTDVGLDRDDLYLLMESYRNTIELNTTLIERQETLNTGIERILTDIAKICGDQFSLREALSANRIEETKEHARGIVHLYGIIGLLLTIIIGLLAIIVKGAPV